MCSLHPQLVGKAKLIILRQNYGLHSVQLRYRRNKFTFCCKFYRYPSGYFYQTYEFDFFNYAGIHRPVRLYTTPVTYLSDITITTNYDENVSVGVVKFSSVVGAGCSSLIGTNQIKMEYVLKDKEGVPVASVSGADMYDGQLHVKYPILWWPVGMSDKTAYLYTLQVCVYIQDYFNTILLLLVLILGEGRQGRCRHKDIDHSSSFQWLGIMPRF